MRRTTILSAACCLTALFLALGAPNTEAFFSGDKCNDCHFAYVGSPTEGCISCHQGALHHAHVYRDPGQASFPRCGSPADTCRCCHGDPPSYEDPPHVTDACMGCHGIVTTGIVGKHECSPFYHPPAGERCVDCHETGVPGHLIVPEEDANNNCHDTLDNDADCDVDNADSGCAGIPGDEICDDGKDNDFDLLIDGADPDCCGDGVTTPPETCDDGNRIDCDGCSDTCQEEYCGDGVICPHLGEECEVDGDCEEGFFCDGTCTCRRAAAPCGATVRPAPGATATSVSVNVGLLFAPAILLGLRRRERLRRS